jgi:pimeloyl-ACP methyl ester carboxylesterase
MFRNPDSVSRLGVLPRTGHTTNLEEPAQSNYFLQEFFSVVESGRRIS